MSGTVHRNSRYSHQNIILMGIIEQRLKTRNRDRATIRSRMWPYLNIFDKNKYLIKKMISLTHCGSLELTNFFLQDVNMETMLVGALSYLLAIVTTRYTRDSAVNLAHNLWIYLLPVIVFFSDVQILFFQGVNSLCPIYGKDYGRNPQSHHPIQTTFVAKNQMLIFKNKTNKTCLLVSAKETI